MLDGPRDNRQVGAFITTRRPVGEVTTPVVAGDQPVEHADELAGQLHSGSDVTAQRLVLLVFDGVLGQRLVQIVGQRRIGDEQTVLLAAERPVDPRESLHQQRTLEGPVEVERVQRRRVVAGEHHRVDDHELQLIVGVLQTRLDHLVLRLATNVLGHGRLVGRRAGVNDLELARADVVGVPVGAQLGDRVVQPGADLAGATDDHCLAGRVDELLHHRATVLPVRDEVLGEPGDAGRRAVDGVDDGDTLLDAVSLDVVQAGSELVCCLVERVLGDALGEVDLDQSRLEVHRDRGAVFDGAGEVIDVDVLTEHVAGVLVRERDRGAGERDQRRLRQRVLEVSCVAVEAVVVAAVRLVDDDDDVAPVRQQRVRLAGGLLLR